LWIVVSNFTAGAGKKDPGYCSLDSENHPQQARFTHVSSKTAIALMSSVAMAIKIGPSCSTSVHSYLLVTFVLLL